MAVENAECPDYITEKLWRPLTLGVVPIYWGAPNVVQWLPNNQSVIDVRNYSSPEQLAQHLHQLLANDTEYEKYLDHKLKRLIRNKFLKEAVTKREWGINNDPNRVNFIEHFECEVCTAVLRQRKTGQPYVADQSHYDCPPPLAVLDTMKKKVISREEGPDELNNTNDQKFTMEPTDYTDKLPSEYGSGESHWLEEWHRAKLEADKLREMLVSGRYQTDSYHQDIIDHLIKHGHFRRFPPPIHNEL